MTHVVVYCLAHPYHENSDAWILSVYDDENVAKSIVDDLTNVYKKYRQRRSNVLLNVKPIENGDEFKQFKADSSMNENEQADMLSIHPRSLLYYSFDDDDALEYGYDIV